MTLIKMCGLFREADIYAANKVRPDFIGFVFSEKSRRYVPPERAEALKKLLDPSIKAVGVFTDFPLSGIEALENAASSQDGAAYNLMGIKVDPASVRGIYIKNGKKYYKH